MTTIHDLRSRSLTCDTPTRSLPNGNLSPRQQLGLQNTRQFCVSQEREREYFSISLELEHLFSNECLRAHHCTVKSLRAKGKRALGPSLRIQAPCWVHAHRVNRYWTNTISSIVAGGNASEFATRRQEGCRFKYKYLCNSIYELLIEIHSKYRPFHNKWVTRNPG